jgi:hypothetical protein
MCLIKEREQERVRDSESKSKSKSKREQERGGEGEGGQMRKMEKKWRKIWWEVMGSDGKLWKNNGYSVFGKFSAASLKEAA